MIERSILDLYIAMVGPIRRTGGGSQNCLCPFHSDSTPSMKLDIEKNVARCYSCRRTWTPDQFEREMLGLDRVDTLSNDRIRGMVDQFEAQILKIFELTKKRPADYKKVFVALDKAREKSDLTYDDLTGLLSIVKELTA